MLGDVEVYNPPDWAQQLSFIPKNRVHLSNTNTPIHPWTLPGVPAPFSVSVKRDDLTGTTLTGNKVRKLEFLLADALDRGCRHVITCGALQSNHCRAVALSCRRLGLIPHLVLNTVTKATDAKSVACDGNMLLTRLCGAHIYLVPRKPQSLADFTPWMERVATHIKQSSGEDSYTIPFGGSNKLGLFGFIAEFEELIQQGVLERFDDLVFPCSSGGTAAGLAIVNHLTGEKIRLHGAAVGSQTAARIHEHCDQMFEELGMGHLKSRHLLRLMDKCMGEGYGISTDRELDFIQQVATTTGVVLDPVYNSKAALAMVRDMHNNPTAYKGRRALFIHTGGIFGLYDGRMIPFLKQKQEQQPLIRMWSNL